MPKELKDLITKPEVLNALDYLHGLGDYTEFREVDREKVHSGAGFPKAWYNEDEYLLMLPQARDAKALDRLIYYVGGEREARLVGYAENEYLIFQMEDNDRFGHKLMEEADDS